MSHNSGGHLNLAKFAFNIYGTLNNLPSESNSPPSSSSSSKSKQGYYNKFNDRLVYNCEREVSCLTDLELVPNPNTAATANNSHVVIGGKNYLKLLTLNQEQSSILNEHNILEPLTTGSSRLPGGAKLHNFNTIKSNGTLLAGGMVNGSLNLYQVLNNGKSRVIKRFTDHKRCINSLDFLDPVNNEFSSNMLISGSQDGSIKLWDVRLASNKPSVNILPKSNFDSIRSCQFSNHSSVRNKVVILSVHDSGTLNKYDLRSFNQATQVPERKWNFHTGPALSLNVHPEKEYVITCGRDQKVCVWNYGENNNSYSNTTPDYVLHTYGPVMKVRWCPYANLPPHYAYDDDDETYDNRDVDNRTNNPLFNYDFACLYLNEDPSITVYNLSRKYVPKEIINSYSNKPYQNFIWAKNKDHKRRLWTLSKGNQYASRCLDTPSEFEDITRPNETLNSVSVAWGNSIGDISLISQEKTEFEGLNFTHGPRLGNPIGSNDNTIDSAIDSDTGINGSKDNYDLNDSSNYNKLVVGSVPNSFSNASLQNTSLGSSPMEMPSSRPPLFRSSTHNAALQNQVAKSPSPSPQIRNSLSFYNIQDLPLSQRPSLGRNPSQTTIESGMSIGSPTNRLDTHGFDARRAIQINYASPYIIPLSMPLPLNDDTVFETLSNNYLLTIPDGFSLIDVCLLNASVAASVNRFRDCQIWRMLAEGLGQYESDRTLYHDDALLKYSQYDENDHGDTEPDEANDNKSILSEYGNFGGSFNSNSTLTTNYGGSFNTGLTSDKRSSKVDIPANTWNEMKSSSTNNLMDMINQNRNNSFANTISISPLSPNASRSNSMIAQVNNLRLATNIKSENESAVEDDDTYGEAEIQAQPRRRRHSQRNESESTNNESTLKDEDSRIESKQEKQLEEEQDQEPNNKLNAQEQEEGKTLKRYSSVPILNPKKQEENSTSPRKKAEASEPIKYGSSPKNIAFMNRLRSKNESPSQLSAYGSRANIYGSSLSQRNLDLDNENFHLLNNAANSSLSSSEISSNIPSADHKSSIGSIPSNYMGSLRNRRRSSSIAPTYGFLNSRYSYSNGLREVDETSNDSERQEERVIQGSGLTKAIEENKEKLQRSLEAPWKISNLLERALDHASLQGDVILCSSLALLFYSFSKSLGLKFIKQESCLEWLSLYIEVLHKKRLFVNATNILNIAPKELQEKLLLLYNCDSLRFYCENCNELITNEETKMKYNEGRVDNVGFWFCDKCKVKLLNCIYCNEPCLGLNVVVGLKCGHRGHFGCLREWFIEDENVECPGGCNETVF